MIRKIGVIDEFNNVGNPYTFNYRGDKASLCSVFRRRQYEGTSLLFLLAPEQAQWH
jgi:hypothetical protein